MKSNNNCNSNAELYARIQAIKMSQSERREALAALASAVRLVAAAYWVVDSVKGFFAHAPLKPSLKH